MEERVIAVDTLLHFSCSGTFLSFVSQPKGGKMRYKPTTFHQYLIDQSTVGSGFSSSSGQTACILWILFISQSSFVTNERRLWLGVDTPRGFFVQAKLYQWWCQIFPALIKTVDNLDHQRLENLASCIVHTTQSSQWSTSHLYCDIFKSDATLFKQTERKGAFRRLTLFKWLLIFICQGDEPPYCILRFFIYSKNETSLISLTC